MSVAAARPDRRIALMKPIGEVPATPDGGVVSGLIWPPVDGRLILHELSQSPIGLMRSEWGYWWGIASGKWRLYSQAEAVFPEVEQGRSELMQAARTQASLLRVNPVSCSVVLSSPRMATDGSDCGG